MKWIMVETRLPKPGERVLVWANYVVQIAGRDHNNGWSSGMGQPVYYPVSHWMYLPNGPRG